jgi:hypothetical protein
VEGLIHISELSNRRIQHPKDVVKEGDVVPVKLVRIERDRHRLGLSLRQARADAEAMGFVFNHDGAVIDYPDDIREQFGLPPRDESMPAPTPRSEPRNAHEAIERAVARDPEPVSAFAHAFAQALENAEAGNAFANSFESAAPESAPAPEAADVPGAALAEALPAEAETAAEPVDEAVSAALDESAKVEGAGSAEVEESASPSGADAPAASAATEPVSEEDA